MVQLDICGIAVDFPFQPYDSQLVYMEKVILALTSKQNAVLESPTGTGKTLCLLCATLGWRRHMKNTMRSSRAPTRAPMKLGYDGYEEDEETKDAEKDALPRIIYSSRTHSQLKQVVQELKNTAYSPSVAVLGSREHLCVEPKISQMRGTRQNLACRAVAKNKRCVYKRGFDAVSRRTTKSSLPIMDIEELVEAMKEKEVRSSWICPFFLSRSVLPDADIVFVPYNYLIDPLARRSIGISIENSVLIFDEAHNVESIASEAASYALSSTDIAGCVAEVQQFIQALSEHRIVLSPTSSLSTESAETLRALLLEIDKGLNTFPLSSTGGFTKPGEYIFEFFQQFNVNFETCPLVLSLIEEIIEVANEGNDERRASSKLDSLLSFLGTIFRNKEQHLKVAGNYRVHIQEIQERASNTSRVFNGPRKGSSKTRVFNYWCFHPGVSFREICANNVYNVILTSGTLSPLETTITELGIDFPVRLENSHVIDANQVWVGVVGTGVTGKRLNSSYNFRSTDEYLLELGNTIVNFVRLVPSGLLVFFPSYSILEESIARWQRPAAGESSSSIWSRISQQKEVFVEPRGRVEFKTVVDEYHQTIKDKPNGAIFFAVCRGKVSEGIDFSNDKGRAVVITGLPFPPTKDPKIVLKKSILDEVTVAPGDMKLTGNHWYIQQASRAVNQAIGRVIRHRHDYGAIILLDERFALQQQQKCLSKWLQPYCRTCKNYGEAHIGLTRFFKSNKANAPAAPPVPEKRQKAIGLTRVRRSNLDDGISQDLSQLTQNDGRDMAIGDGQSYVNPELFRQPQAIPEVSNTVVPKPMPPRQQPREQRKRTLGSFLSMSSATSMVESTSSISRPFVLPRAQVQQTNDIESAIEIASENPDGAASWQEEKRRFSSEAQHERTPVSAFPSVVRRLLAESEVTKLYGFIRRLHGGDHVDEALRGICEMLASPGRHEILRLMPKVLKGSISTRFVSKLNSLGITLPSSEEFDSRDVDEASEALKAQPTSSMSSFFQRLQQKKIKKNTHGTSASAATIVKDPQCFVCYDMTRKAYASQCGHICCLGCWKKMEKDGFTSCPVCKVPIKLENLSLIRAERTASSKKTKNVTEDS